MGSEMCIRGRFKASSKERIKVGIFFNFLPANSPTIPSPVNCCHHVSVCLSYIIKSDFLNLPDVPKSKTLFSNLLSKTIDALHNGQYVTETGIPPT